MAIPPVDLCKIMPHRPPMLLVEKVLSMQDNSARVRACNPAGGLFADSAGFVLPCALIEMTAQSYAAFDGTRRFLEGTLPQDGGGFLVNVRDFCFFKPVRAGQNIEVEVTIKDRFFDTRIVEGVVWADGEKAAAGQVYIFVWEKNAPQEEK